MVLGVSLAAATTLVGKRGATRTKDLVAALGAKAKGTRLTQVRHHPEPERAILKVTWTKTRSHYVVKDGAYIHDPIMPWRMDRQIWDRWMAQKGGRVTSWLQISEAES